MARLVGGTRYSANPGGRVDVEFDRYMAQVKHVARLSLAQLEALAVEIAGEGRRRNKCGLLIVKRRGGRGRETSRLVYVTEEVWRTLQGPPGPPRPFRPVPGDSMPFY